MGADQLSRCQCDRASDQWLPGELAGPQAFLYDMHRGLHCQLFLLWNRSEPWNTAPVQDNARGFWWRTATHGTSHSRRYISASEAWAGLCPIWDLCSLRTSNWSYTGGLD